MLKETAAGLARTSKAYSPSLESATHIGNTVLGLVALEKGDLSAAADHLIASGSLKSGSPTLRSFGPNMLLAKKLIEKGERDAVIHYLDACAAFWRLENGRLAEWKKVIESGGMPDFGPSLGHEVSYWKR
jgi:hypothetical protein